jgi:hypothetical protein
MSKALERVENIVKSIEDIEFILGDSDIKLTQAIENKIIKPAIRMHIVKIAEQFTQNKGQALNIYFWILGYVWSVRKRYQDGCLGYPRACDMVTPTG